MTDSGSALPGTVDSYFAYGTLLGETAIHEYCPTATAIAVARYPSHQLEFRQYSDDTGRCGCNLAATPGRDMYGVVYKITPEELSDLDEVSGVGQGWFKRVPILVESVDGQSMQTSTYFLCDPGPTQVPAPDYLGLVRVGAREAGLPADYASELETYLDSLAG
jgi:hypothetical protein